MTLDTRRIGLLTGLLLTATVVGQSPDVRTYTVPSMPTSVVAEPLAGETAGTIAYTESWPAGPRAWASAEYVGFLIGTGKLVELAKETYNSDTFNALLAAAGKNYKDVVQTLLGDDRTGFRLRAGVWLDPCETLGVEAAFLYLNRGPLNLTLGNRDGSPLARVAPDADLYLTPRRQFDPTLSRIEHPLLALLLLRRLGVQAPDLTGRQVVVPLGAIDLINARMNVEIAEQTFWMFDVLGRGRLLECDGGRVDGLIGYRRISYSAYQRITTQAVTLQRPLLPGTQIVSSEGVTADNTFDGVLLGLDLSTAHGWWTLTARPTLTVARLNARVTRDSATLASIPGRPLLNFASGAFLTEADLGEVSASRCTVIPELALGATRTCGDHVRLLFGSSLLYLPEVARSSNQLEFGIPPSRGLSGRETVPAPPPPTSPELKSQIIMTLSAGLEFRY